MDVFYPKPAFEDQRGAITDILERVEVDCITMITSRAGAVRGNHYHEASTQYVHVIQGRIRVGSQTPGGAVAVAELGPGALLKTPPLERHAIRAVEDSVFLVYTHGPRGGRDYKDDTFRVDPLLPEFSADTPPTSRDPLTR